MSAAAKLVLMRRAAELLRSGEGSRASGWVDGYTGLDPDPVRWGQPLLLSRYEAGWLEGAEARAEEEAVA